VPAQKSGAHRYSRGPHVRGVQPCRPGPPGVDQLLRALAEQLGRADLLDQLPNELGLVANGGSPLDVVSKGWEGDTEAITAKTAVDGIYVIPTSVSTQTLPSAGVVGAYKDLAKVAPARRSATMSCRSISGAAMGCQGQPRTKIEGGGHFLQNDCGPTRAQVTLDLIDPDP